MLCGHEDMELNGATLDLQISNSLVNLEPLLTIQLKQAVIDVSKTFEFPLIYTNRNLKAKEFYSGFCQKIEGRKRMNPNVSVATETMKTRAETTDPWALDIYAHSIVNDITLQFKRGL